jgi:hypothetical protein
MIAFVQFHWPWAWFLSCGQILPVVASLIRTVRGSFNPILIILTDVKSDWRVAGGLVNGTDSFNTFQAILGNATLLDTG